MLSFRTTAALAGLLPAFALCGGAASYPALSPGATLRSASQLVHLRPAARIGRSAFRVAVRRHYGPPANASGYSVLVVTGARQAWAFGGTNPGGPSKPIAARWDGRTMTPSALPGGLAGFISDASAPAANDIWAASQYGRYVLHWDGRRWRVAREWRRGQITGLIAISARDVWAFGTDHQRGARARYLALRRQVLAASGGPGRLRLPRQRRVSPGYLGHRCQPGFAVHPALQRNHVASPAHRPRARWRAGD